MPHDLAPWRTDWASFRRWQALTPETVNDHVKHILACLDVPICSQFEAWATVHGLHQPARAEPGVWALSVRPCVMMLQTSSAGERNKHRYRPVLRFAPRHGLVVGLDGPNASK